MVAKSGGKFPATGGSGFFICPQLRNQVLLCTGVMTMGNPQTPLAKAKLTGAAAKNPQRFRHRADPTTDPLGAAPSWLSGDAKKAWKKFAAEWPWLTKSDEAGLATLCMMRAQVEGADSAGLTAAFFREYRMQISAFGGTPTTKGKIHQGGADDEDDPFAGLVKQ